MMINYLYKIIYAAAAQRDTPITTLYLLVIIRRLPEASVVLWAVVVCRRRYLFPAPRGGGGPFLT